MKTTIVCEFFNKIISLHPNNEIAHFFVNRFPPYLFKNIIHSCNLCGKQRGLSNDLRNKKNYLIFVFISE